MEAGLDQARVSCKINNDEIKRGKKFLSKEWKKIRGKLAVDKLHLLLLW